MKQKNCPVNHDTSAIDNWPALDYDSTLKTSPSNIIVRGELYRIRVRAGSIQTFLLLE